MDKFYFFPVFFYLLFSTVNSKGQVLINEVMAKNSTTIADEFGEFDDWIELYNAGDEDIDMAGYYLTDDVDTPVNYWQIPSGSPALTTVPAGGFLILWADKDEEQGANHLNFKLGAGGEHIALLATDGATILDELIFGQQSEDVSYGRIEDGGDDFDFFLVATPGTSNQSQALPQVFAGTINRTIQAVSDDAVEHQSGGLYVETYDMSVEKDGSFYKMGFRFADMGIPKGATVNRVWIQFYSKEDEEEDEEAEWTIAGQASGNSLTFVETHDNISDRPLTVEKVTWEPEPWYANAMNGPAQRTPDLSAIVQEIIDLPDWELDHALVFIISGEGERTTYSFDGLSQYAASLHVEFEAASPIDLYEDIFINEMAPNSSTYADANGDVEDWIELYNGGTEPVNIGGLFLSDNPNNLLKWQIAASEVIDPGDFAIIYADKEPERGGLHAVFNLKADGETVILSQVMDNELVILDSITYPAVPAFASYGRTTDGDSDWTFFGEMTPDAPNEEGSPYLAPPVITPERGVYSDNVTVSISHNDEDAEIHFTTDGSEPDDDDPLYQNAFTVSDTQSVIIRAKAYKDGQAPSISVEQSYLFDIHHDLPVVMLTTDPANLWDDETGIYTVGTNGIPGNYCGDPNPMANYYQDWERPARLTMYEPDGTMDFSVNAGIKISGKCSRKHPSKSLNIFLRKNKYGDKYINYPIFASRESTKYKRLRLRNGGSDFTRKMIQDPAIQLMLMDYLDYQAYRPVVLYLNGEYWGIMNFREKYGADYVKRNYGLDKDEFDMIKDPGLKNNLREGDLVAFQDMYYYIGHHDMSDADNYSYIQTLMDDNNFLNYWIAQVYIANRDWPGNNKQVWREKDNGRFKWQLMDTDISAGIFGDTGGASASAISIGYATDENSNQNVNHPNSTLIFRKLLENQYFKNEYIQRSCSFMQLVFSAERTGAIIDSLAGLIDSEIENHINRWDDYMPVWHDYDHWQGEIVSFKEFFEDRPQYWIDQIDEHFSLNGTFDLTINCDENSGGNVFFHSNQMLVPYDYSGTYFKDVPIEITAVAKAGYTFSHWLETGETTPTISFTAHSDKTLTPIFGTAGVLVVDLGEDRTVCQNEQVIITASVSGCDDCTFLWNDGHEDISNSVTPDETTVYSVTVIDGEGAIGRDSVTVFVSQIPAVDFDVVSIRCFGENNGQITVNASGVAPFSYEWENGDSTDVLENISAGTYTVQLSDGNECTYSYEVEVPQPEALAIELDSMTDASCHGKADGQASINVSGGTLPYSYAWSDGSTNETLENVPAGEYTVVITDAHECEANYEITVEQPEVLVIELTSKTDVSCYGESNGQASVNISGGTLPYTYAWSDGSTNETLENVPAGEYTVAITDAHECEANYEVTIIEPDPLRGTVIITNPTSEQGGAIAVTPNGGTPPVEILWNTGENSFLLAGLDGGTYDFVLTDSHGCEYDGEVVLVNPLGADDIPGFSGLVLYPNPNYGRFSIKWQSVFDDSAIFTVFDVLGRKVTQKQVELLNNNVMMDISTVSKGIYFLKIKIKRGSIWRKFTVE